MIYTAVPGRAIPLGYLGENLVEAVVFDRTCWLSEYGPGTFELIHRRSQDTDPFPIAVTVSGGTVTWIPTESDTAYRGVGECQLSFYTPDGKLKKSEIYQTVTARSLTSAEDPPSPAQGWVEQVLQAAAGIQNMQADAETLVPGSAATVTKTVDPDTGVVMLTFGIPEGLKGDTGRGIASMSVLSTGEWRVIYTDGTSETVGYDVYSAIDALKTAAQEAAETASGAAGTAVDAATSAAGSAANAAGSAESAATSAQNASHDADRAEQGAEDAQESATAAAGSATSAAGSASSAASANTAAQQAKTDAIAAKTDAETAARNAEEWASQVDPDNLAHIDGSYPDMTVGNAEQLVSTLFVEGTEPYTFRKAGGSHDIGNREYDEIVGGSLPWNQIIRNGNFADGATGWTASTAYSSVSVSAGVLTLYHTGTSTRSYGVQTTASVVAEHKYLFAANYVRRKIGDDADLKKLVLKGNTTVLCTLATNVEPDVAMRVRSVFASPTDYQTLDIRFGGSVSNPYSEDNDKLFELSNVNLFDLTLMFGSTIADYIYSLEQANAGAGVAWFRRYFPNDFYSYTPGNMESVQVSAHKTVGFNAYNPATGTAKVLGGMQYQITGAYTALAIDGAAITPDTDGIFTPSKNGTLTVTGGDSTTTCVHLVNSGYRNGEYEPYVEHNYPLDSSLTLRGIPTLDGDKLKFNGDIYSADGTVTRRYGIADLGQRSWTRLAAGYFRSDGLNNIRVPSTTAVVPKWILLSSGGYKTESPTHIVNNPTTYDKCVAVSTSGYLMISDSAYTDAATFKAAMSGVMLVYELATPTTETAEPFQSPQIVDDFGTEEYVDAGFAAGTRDFAFPVGHDTKYPPNLRDKLQKLPSAAADDGRYVIQQTDGNMALVPDTSPGQIAALAVRVPDPPTTDGTYRLTVTVTDGIPAYSWVQA